MYSIFLFVLDNMHKNKVVKSSIIVEVDKNKGGVYNWNDYKFLSIKRKNDKRIIIKKRNEREKEK